MKMRIAAMVLCLLCNVSGVMASSPYLPEDDLKREAQVALDQILDLWRDGKLTELYDLSLGARTTMEGFTRRLAAAPLKPACCWQKMQEVTVKLQGDTKALVRAKLGFEGRGGVHFKTKSLKLEKDDGVWRMSRADIFSLAEAGAGKRGYRAHRR